jgi:hypothetical protein
VFGEDLEYFNEGPKYEITFRIAYLIWQLLCHVTKIINIM